MSQKFVNRREFTFTWKIKNYSSCYHTNGMELRSPTITAATMDDSQWYLSLYPRGFDEAHKEYISCFLHRAENDSNGTNICLRFNIDIMSPQRKVLNSWQTENFEFKRGQGHGSYDFMKINQFSNEFENWFEDNLIVRCHMSSEIREKKLFNECEIHTQINVVRSSYKWILKTEDSPSWTERKKFPFLDSSNLEVTLTSPEDDLIIAINKDIHISPYRYVTCQISLLDMMGTKRHSKFDAYFFTEANNRWSFPNFLTKKHLKAEKDAILRDGTFILMFEFTTSNGIDAVAFEKYTCSKFLDFYPPGNTISALQNDLQSMLMNAKYCDIRLGTDNVSLPAHKSILTARSPVFSVMLDQDMLENREGFVDLSDLDEKTLKLFLDFLYTGKLDDLNQSTALDLLVIADKYQIESLKEMCASVLMSTLSEENVCEVLVVSDMLGCSLLKEYALKYVLTHSGSILSSTKWSDWVENHIKLATEVFSKMVVQFGGETNKSLGKTAFIKFDAEPFEKKHGTVTGTGVFGSMESFNFVSSSATTQFGGFSFGRTFNHNTSGFGTKSVK